MLVCLETPGRLSVGVSLGAISLQPADGWELSPLPSDNDAEDIVFPAQILPARWHYCFVIMFLC